MPIHIKSLLVCISIGISTLLQAQKTSAPKIEKKVEIFTRFNGQDSLPRHDKEWHYDEEGRLIQQKEYIYSTNASAAPGTLAREINISYNDKSNLWVSITTNYFTKKDAETEKLKIKYQSYHANPSKNQPLWTQTYGKNGDIIKEDTMTYNDAGQIIKSCSYNYRGTTSLFCDNFFYDKKGRRKKWQTFYKWTTINGRSQVVERSKKRRNYRYKYNKNNKLVKGRGRYYSTKYKEDRTYDDNGLLASVEIEKIRKTRNSKKRRQATGERFTINGDTRTERYENGNLTYLHITENGVEKNREEYTYQDSLLQEYTFYTNNKKHEVGTYHYNDEGHLTLKTTDKYDTKGVLSYTLYSTYNEAGNLEKDVQKAGEAVLSTTILVYDDYDNLISKTMYLKNDIKFEKTSYIYTYFTKE